MANIDIGALQGALAVSGSYKSRVDGVTGPMTRKAIVKKPEVARAIADKVGGELSALVEDAIAGDQPDKDVIQAITDAAAEFGVPVDTMLAKAKIESGLNPSVVNRYGYSGLFQMGQSAWAEAQAYIEANGYPAIGSFSQDKLKALANARAACAYRLVLIDQLASQGINNPSEAELYLSHQQGAYGYAVLKRAASGRALPERDKSRVSTAMRNNPPQDGKGVTYDPKSFLARWETVFDERLGQA